MTSNSSMSAVGTAKAVLEYTQFNYPWVILFIFLVAFASNSILTSESTTESITPTVTGPGGKPLPQSALKSKQEKEKRKLQDFSPVRKLLFIWLSALLLGTFIGNGVNIVIHALVERDQGWWCGEAAAVSCKLGSSSITTILTLYL